MVQNFNSITGVIDTNSKTRYWPTTTGTSTISTGTYISTVQSYYITKEELDKTLTSAFTKQRLILERDRFKAAGLDPKALKAMLESTDPETVKYAETVVENFMD